MTIADFYAGFDDRVREVVAYGYAHSSAFRARLDAASIAPDAVQCAADLAKIPVLRKEDLITLQRQGPNLGGMLTVPLSGLRRVFQSPGPIYDPEPNEPDPWRWAAAISAAGIGADDTVLNAFGYHLTPAGAMFEEGAKQIGCTVVPGGIGNQAQQIDVLAHLGVTAYVGLPSYLKALLEKAREAGHDPRTWPLTKAIVTAEPLPPSLRTLLHDEYGIAVSQVYGTAETGNLGYEGPERNGLHLPDDALVQVCDINSGEPLLDGATGEVVVTLFRQDYILVRFGVGDLSALMVDAPPAQIATPRLVGWLGRSGDSVKVRGIFVHPRHIAEALRGLPGLTAYQVVVTRHEHRDDVTCRIVAEGDSNTLEQQVVGALHDALKLRSTVEVVATLPDDAPPFVDERTWE